jgi:hypothetical protein
MIRYAVIWDDQLLLQFQEYWLAGDSRTRCILTEVANWADRELATKERARSLG